MSKSEIAKHCGHLAVGAVALSLGVGAGATIGAIAAVNMAGIWRDMKSACVPTARNASISAALAALEGSRDFPQHALDQATALLASPPASAQFRPDDTIDLLATDTFVSETANRLVTSLNAGDAATDAVLTLALSAALTACMQSPDFRTGIQWEIDLSTLQAVYRLERLFGDAIRLAQERSHLADGQVIQMAKRLSPDVSTREEAIAALDQVVGAAQRIAERGATPSNHPDFIDQVFAEVARLNAEDRPDDAATALQEALAEEQQASAARQMKLLDGLLDQHLLRRDADAYAEVLERKLRLDGEENLFHRLRALGIEHQNTGTRLGTAFDLRVAVAVTHQTEPLAPNAEYRGWALNDRGVALRPLGERGDDAALQGAVTAYRAALEVRTRDALPVDWAMTQNNLAIVLMTLGQRGNDAALQDAVTAYRATLEVYTRNALPENWAITQNNLGIALLTLGERGDDTALQDAVTAYRAALEIRTRDALPVNWAATQNNLGNALLTLGQRGDDAALRNAVTAYRAALEVHTRDALPVDWAGTRTNMALCFEAMAKADPANAAHHLAEALGAVDDALTIYTPEHMSFYFEKATALRDRILAAIARL